MFSQCLNECMREKMILTRNLPLNARPHMTLGQEQRDQRMPEESRHVCAPCSSRSPPTQFSSTCLLLPAGQVHTPHFLLVLAGIKLSVCSL